MSMHPAEYWRKSKEWSQLIFKQGTVVQSTLLQVTPSAQSEFGNYSFLVVAVGKKTVEVMGVPGETFSVGDTVRFVLRRMAKNTATQPISYGLKAEKIT